MKQIGVREPELLCQRAGQSRNAEKKLHESQAKPALQEDSSPGLVSLASHPLGNASSVTWESAKEQRKIKALQLDLKLAEDRIAYLEANHISPLLVICPMIRQ